MAKIIFTSAFEVAKEFTPKPASFFIPDWYKNMESYIGGVKRPSGEGRTTATIKRCMPVFDSITSGYIIPTYVDVFVSQKKEFNVETNETTEKTFPWYEWPSLDPLGWHPIDQAPNHPKKGNLPNNAAYPKWMNPWSIKTPPGYSVLIISPMHRTSNFTIFDGIVDTDTYSAPINFPFVLNKWNFEGLISAGTPMAQIIPFKRESWEMSLGNNEERLAQNSITKNITNKFFDAYKTQYRQVKEYK